MSKTIDELEEPTPLDIAYLEYLETYDEKGRDIALRDAAELVGVPEPRLAKYAMCQALGIEIDDLEEREKFNEQTRLEMKKQNEEFNKVKSDDPS